MAVQGPKYQRVIEWIKENIENGSLRSGDRLMSEMELSERFSLSRQTIRHATGELVREHVLYRVKGSGTYIGDGKTAETGTVPEAQKGMRRASSGTVAVVSTFHESYIFPEIMKGIERVLSENGYSMQVSFTDNRLSREEEILKNILEKDNIDGLIVEPAKSALPNPNLDYYREIRKRSIPIVFFNAVYPQLEAPCVRMDDTRVAAKATRLLIEKGHVRIAGIFKGDDRQGPLRYQGYLEEMIRSGYRAQQQYVLWLDTIQSLAMSDLEDYIFRRLEGATAVVCYNDQVAWQLEEMAQRRGIDIPSRLSVVSIDDSYMAGMCRIPLTSFPHPKSLLGQKAAENILTLIKDPAFDANALFDSEPVIRESM